MLSRAAAFAAAKLPHGGAINPVTAIDIFHVLGLIGLDSDLLGRVKTGEIIFPEEDLALWQKRHKLLSETPYLGRLLIDPERNNEISNLLQTDPARGQRELANDFIISELRARALSSDATLKVGTRASQGLPPPAPALSGVARFSDDLASFVAARTGAGQLDHDISPTDRNETEGPVSTALTRDTILGQLQDENGYLRVRPSEDDVQWKVLRVLGQGGMGVVILAEEVEIDPSTNLEQTGRRVAIKVATDQDSIARERFRVERRVHRQLGTGIPHILTCYASGQTVNSLPFMVLQLVDGSLVDLLNSSSLGSWDNRLTLFTDFLEGVALVHERGYIHRDIKPDNIFFSTRAKSGEVMTPENTQWLIADLGIVLTTQEAEQGKDNNNTIGTPGYMPPEVVPHNQYSTSGDVFALGVVLYELLTGIHPSETCPEEHKFDGPIFKLCSELWARHIIPPSNWNRDIPERLSTIVMKALHPDVGERYAEAGELRKSLMDFENWLTADKKWQEATQALTRAHDALEKGFKEQWIRHARQSYNHAREALRIYQEPEWLDITIRVLKKTLDIAEADGNEILIDEVHQHMLEVSNLCGSIIDETPVFTPIMLASHQPGEINLPIRGLPAKTQPQIQIYELKEVNGVITPVAEIETDHFSLRPSKSEGWVFNANLPRGNYAICVRAEDYHPLKDVFHLARGGELQQVFEMLPNNLVPNGFMPIVGGWVDYNPKNRRFNIPPLSDPDSLKMRAYVPPFLAAKSPVTNFDYFKAMVKLTLDKARELRGKTGQWEKAIEYGASRTLTAYFEKTDFFLEQFLRRWNQEWKGLDLDRALTHFFGDPIVVKEFVDGVGDVIVWNAPAVWTNYQHVTEIVKALEPNGRLPTDNEVRRLIAGSDRRKNPWGDSDPDEASGNFSLITSEEVIPAQTPVGQALYTGGRGYLDLSPLSIPEIGATIFDVAGTRVWISQTARFTAPNGQISEFPMTAGVGYSVSYRNPLQKTFGIRNGPTPAASIRIVQNYPIDLR